MAPSMSNTRPSASRRVSKPIKRARPPKNSSSPMSGPIKPGKGTPMWVNASVTPAKPKTNNFCAPCLMKIVATARRSAASPRSSWRGEERNKDIGHPLLKDLRDPSHVGREGNRNEPQPPGLRPGSPSKFFHHSSLPCRNILGARALRASLAIQAVFDPTAARLMLIHDGRSVGRGPAVAPLGQGDDHGLEVEPLFRQVVRLIPLRPTRRGHDPCLDEVLQPCGEHIGCDLEAFLKIGEARHAGERRVTKDEEAPALPGDLQRARRGAHFLVIGPAEHAWMIVPPL